MKKSKSVRLLCDVFCDWQGRPPRYRLFVNGELFTERTFDYQDFYLEEAIVIEGRPGRYKIEYQLLDADLAQLKIKNPRIDFGNATLHKHMVLEILE